MATESTIVNLSSQNNQPGFVAANPCKATNFGVDFKIPMFFFLLLSAAGAALSQTGFSLVGNRGSGEGSQFGIIKKEAQLSTKLREKS